MCKWQAIELWRKQVDTRSKQHRSFHASEVVRLAPMSAGRIDPCLENGNTQRVASHQLMTRHALTLDRVTEVLVGGAVERNTRGTSRGRASGNLSEGRLQHTPLRVCDAHHRLVSHVDGGKLHGCQRMRDQRFRRPGKHAHVHVVSELQRVEPHIQRRLVGRDLGSSTDGGLPGKDT